MDSKNNITVDLIKSEILVPYEKALEFMQARVKKIISGEESQLLWLLEHPHVYTAGTGANDNDLLKKDKAPVVKTGRGGKYTYHGPGQRVAYVMLDLKKVHNQTPDLKKFVRQLEEWIIKTLHAFNIKGERRDGRVGIWVVNPKGEEIKVAAIGIRVEKWVSYHGVAINIDPDMSYYDGIVPCGINDFKTGSTKGLENEMTIAQFDKELIKNFCEIFKVDVRDAQY